MSAVRTFVRACPRCGGRILWMDGEPTPALTIADGRIVGCEVCMRRGKPVAGPAPRPAQAPAAPAAPRDPRPVRQILAEEGGKVVSFLSEGLDLLDKGATLWDKLTGKRKTP